MKNTNTACLMKKDTAKHLMYYDVLKIIFLSV